ncbi:porin [Methylobacterium sp. sgz302541]|uniref:porin n=1 Tax=unclassified Methylobacterium TaxID=2615210 RepID=UPI003D33EE87
MTRIKSNLLLTAASLAVVSTAASAADLPVKKAVPIEYVRVCGAYGAGFFYIPGTDTCLRVSGRARLDVGYQPTSSRASTNGSQGDTTGYIGLARINLDARTQTGYGTLRAFIRLQFANRTSATGGLRSGTQERIGNAFGATGQDQLGRDQQFMNTDKAFVQFAGLTAGRASSFFDFYAHDFEFAGATANSDVQSTNLLAYTAKFADGFSATVSMEDPTFRRNGIYSQETIAASTPARVLVSTNALGVPTFQTVDVVQRNRVPDFVGVLRYDAAWGSAQLSAAAKELNTGNFLPAAVANGAGQPLLAPNLLGPRGRPDSEYGWAVQGGVKINAPFIAPGDTLYLQGAYGEGATVYTGYSSYTGTYSTRLSTINGAPFDQYMADASFNPITGKIQLSNSFTAVASFLHYWSPEWRSAFFGSYGELNFANGARLANAAAYGSTQGLTATSNQFIGAPGTRSFALSPVLRDNYQFVAGASLIWSPVKDLDLGVEGFYTQIGAKSGRIIDQYKNGPVTAAAVNAGAAVRTVTSEDTYQIRFRAQRDF